MFLKLEAKRRLKSYPSLYRNPNSATGTPSISLKFSGYFYYTASLKGIFASMTETNKFLLNSRRLSLSCSINPNHIKLCKCLNHVFAFYNISWLFLNLLFIVSLSQRHNFLCCSKLWYLNWWDSNCLDFAYHNGWNNALMASRNQK